MSAFAISLGENMSLSPQKYLAALRHAAANPVTLFRNSFRDPRGWIGPVTGAQVVRQHWDAVRDKWAKQWAACHVRGKGAKSIPRADAARRRALVNTPCSWCGSVPTMLGLPGRRFCDSSCARSFA